MIEPVQDILKPCADGARRHLGPVDHHHREVKRARSLELGPCAGATRILGNQQVDAMPLHQHLIVDGGKRSTRNHHLYIRKRQRHLGRINQADQVVMLRSRGEIREVLLADGQKNALGVVRQGLDSTVDIRDVLPPITRTSLPRRALERHQGNAVFGAGPHRMGAHLRGKGMRGVDDRGDAFGAQIVLQSLDTAKAANPRRQGLRHRVGSPARIGKHRVIAAFRQGPRQLRCFAGTAQNKDTWHG